MPHSNVLPAIHTVGYDIVCRVRESLEEGNRHEAFSRSFAPYGLYRPDTDVTEHDDTSVFVYVNGVQIGVEGSTRGCYFVDWEIVVMILEHITSDEIIRDLEMLTIEIPVWLRDNLTIAKVDLVSFPIVDHIGQEQLRGRNSFRSMLSFQFRTVV